MPSVVSMPPNISTAAFETTSSRPRPPAPPAAARGRDRLPGRDAGHRVDDRVVPAENRVPVGARETEGARDDRDGERAGDAAAELRPAGRLDRVDQEVGLDGDERREALAHRVEA